MTDLTERAVLPFTQREFDFRSGELLLLDKPVGWTSFDVVNKIRYRLRRITQVKRIKVGHSGTLDPMASGLLLIAAGRATKQLTELTGLDKIYTGTIQLGATTPSYDAETPVNQTFATEHLSLDLLQKTVEQLFSGWIKQVPPAYSAIKVDGKRLYEAARRGKTVEVPARRVRVDDFQLDNFTGSSVDFSVRVSKGTYIRSLANDLGAAVQSGGYLTQLRREQIGPFSIQDAYRVIEFTDYLEQLPVCPLDS